MVIIKNQNTGSVLTSCWLLWIRRTYFYNFLVSRNYYHIKTSTSQSSLWFSSEYGVIDTKLLMSQVVSYFWFGRESKWLTSNLEQGHYFLIQLFKATLYILKSISNHLGIIKAKDIFLCYQNLRKRIVFILNYYVIV